MKIAFCAQHGPALHANILETRPLGGTETGVVRLAEAMHDLGHEVYVLTKLPNPPPSRPVYVPANQAAAIGMCDLAISFRHWMDVFSDVPRARRRMLLTGDDFRQPSTLGIGDARLSMVLDTLLCVSDWQARTLCEASGFPIEKTWVIRNGIKLSLFEGTEPRTRKRLIYSSIPYRGLGHLIGIFPKVLERHPDAELHIFSGYDVYEAANQNPYNLQELAAMKHAFSQIPNVHFQGNVLQHQLAREMMRSAICAYPNTFDETSCITMMEAQAGGCTIVSSDKGALSETVGDAGILIQGDPGTPAYDAAFVDAVDRILSDDALFERLSEAGRRRAKSELDWNVVAQRFTEYIQASEK